MKTKTVYILMLFIVFFTSCEERFQQNQTVKKTVFSGYVQKGPFINGSTVTILELDKELNQTGRSYNTTVTENTGSFEQKQIELVSNYVQLKADGFYFNEVSGELSSSQLTLYALVDVSDVNSANINVLTHLEKPRVEYLIKNSGKSFEEAKIQAQSELLAIFKMEMLADSTSERLNFTSVGEDNAKLLAISAILQGPLSTADMSQLMADIISDIKTDGTLDNPSLGSALLDNARLTDMTKVRQNLIEKYTELGISEVAIPNFEEYVNDFIENTDFEPEKVIIYPVSGQYGLNILNDTVSKFNSSKKYSLKADLPLGTSLKVVIKGTRGFWFYAVIPAPDNWNVNTYDIATNSQEFIVSESEKNNDCNIAFGNNADSVVIEYYENGALTPTRTKTIFSETYKPVDDAVYTYPEMGIIVNWENILHDSVKMVRSGKVYSMFSLVPLNKKLKVIFKCASKGWIENPNNPSQNWSFNEFNSTTQSQEFNTSGTGKCEMSFTFITTSKVTIEMFENNATVPTKIKYLN